MTRCFWVIVLGAMVSASCATAIQDTHMASAGTMAVMPAPASRTRHADPLQLDVYPRITSDQGDAWVRLRIEPDARSRSLDLEWFSADGGGGAHLITLEGEHAPVRHQFPIRRLAAGEYEVTAVLTRNDGTTVRRTTTVLVVGPEALQ
jgi:hypothetical protein